MPRISPLTTEQRDRLRTVAEARAGTPSNRQLANEMGTSERLIEYYVRKYQHQMERDKRDIAVSRGSMQCEHSRT